MRSPKQQAALDRWLTIHPQDDERPEWQGMSVKEIAERLHDWHAEHPDWNWDSTPQQRRADAKHLHTWANEVAS